MQTLIPKKKLDFWIKNDVNVLLSGKHGIGKTHIVMDVARRHGLKLQYYSCATMDPWVDFIGVPRTRSGTLASGKKYQYLDLIRPKVWATDQVEMLFLDEMTRADPKVQNAILELTQFKSINGKKFKNLRCVWAAINPAPEDTGDVAYHVEPLDPALESRFQVRIQLPFEPALDYMTRKFGAQIGAAACAWWEQLPEKAKNAFPPRSMDYAITYVKKGGAAEDVIPSAVSRGGFMDMLNNAAAAQASDVSPSAVVLATTGKGPLDRALLVTLRNTNSVVTAFNAVTALRAASDEEISTLIRSTLELPPVRVNNLLLALGASLESHRTNKLFGYMQKSMEAQNKPAKAPFKKVAVKAVKRGVDHAERWSMFVGKLKAMNGYFDPDTGDLSGIQWDQRKPSTNIPGTAQNILNSVPKAAATP